MKAPRTFRHFTALLPVFSCLSVVLCAQDMHLGSFTAIDDSVVADVLPKPAFNLAPIPTPDLSALTTPHLHAVPILVGPRGHLVAWEDSQGFGTANLLPNKVAREVARIDLRPAQAEGKSVPAAVWQTCIYNPPSAKLKGPEATPRLEDAFPCAVPADLAAGFPFDGRTLVWVNADIGIQGDPSITAIAPAVPDRLRAFIEEHLRRWKFSPARKNNRPVAAPLRFPVLLVRTETAQGGDRPAYSVALRQCSWADNMGAQPRPREVVECAPVELPSWCAYFPDFLKRHGYFWSAVGSDGRPESVELASDAAEILKPFVEKSLRTWRFENSTSTDSAKEPVPLSLHVSGSGRTLSANSSLKSAPILLYLPAPEVPVSITSIRTVMRTSGGGGISSLRGGSLSGGGIISGYRSGGVITVTTGGTPLSPQRVQFPGALRVGAVRVSFTVTAEGVAENPVVLDSTGYAFNAPALISLRKARFTPGVDQGGQPVSTKTTEVISFTTADDQIADDQVLFAPASNIGSGWYERPVLVTLAQPVFPAEAIDRKSRGEASVRFRVEPTGRVAEVQILKETHACFGKSLTAAIEACHFSPAKKAGQPVSAWLERKETFDPSAPRPRSDIDSLRNASIMIYPELPPETELESDTALDAPLRALHSTPPAHPLTSPLSTEGSSTEVLVEFVIDKQGLVRSPRVKKAPSPEFGYAAIQAVSGWLFSEPLKDGKPVNVRTQIPVSFEGPSAAVRPTQAPSARGLPPTT